MMDFIYEALPGRVIFGQGKLATVREEVARLGIERALVLATPGRRALAERAAALLGTRAVGLADIAEMHVPESVAHTGLDAARNVRADGLVAIGGGSTVGLAKAIALETALPIVAVPTTFAGSEMTPIWGLTTGGAKKTGRDTRVLPRCVIYDPELTLDLPPRIAGPSGMNAIAHCVEALYAENANPVTSLMAEEGIRALAQGLPGIARAPGDIAPRALGLYGAWLAGTCLGSVGMAIHHKLCHTLGGTWNLPHAETHTVVLPHAVAFNAEAAPAAMARIARALGAPSAAAGLFDLALAIGAPTALRDMGMKEADLDRAARLATENPYYNPRLVDRAGVRALLDDAFSGRRPAV